MQRRPLNREMLKGIACITMVLDHIGAVFLPWDGLRVIGRVSFPIFCFLLAEGAHYTRKPGRYALRLLGVAVLAELPYDYLFFGGLHWGHQSAMLTLLIGLGTLWGMTQWHRWQMLIIAVGYLLAEVLRADYGGLGVLLICLFCVTRELRRGSAVQVAAMAVLFWLMGSYPVDLFGLSVPIQLFGMMAVLPIVCYSGRACVLKAWVKWGFYLFYPAHLALLLGVRWILKD